MADSLPIAAGGRVAVTSPSGSVATVPEADLQAALDMGYRLTTSAEHTEARHQRDYGDRPLAAAGLGALSTVTLGGSDVVLGAVEDAAGGFSGESATREISQRNKGARFAGEIGGALTGVGAAGLISGAGKAARAAAGGGLKGAAAAGATEGGLLGVGQTVSDLALSDDPMSAEAVAGGLAKHVLLGGALGGAGGALGELVGRAAGKAREGLRRMGDDLAASAAKPGEKIRLDLERKLELERITQVQKPERAAVLEELGQLRADQKPFREALKPRLASAPAEVRKDLQKAERSLAGLLGNPRRIAGQPEAALEAVANYEHLLKAALGTEPPQLAAGMIGRVGKIRERLEVLAAGPTSPKLAELDGRLAELAKAPAVKEGILAGTAKDAAAAAVFTGVNAAGTALGLPGAGMLSFLLAGKLGGRIANTVGTAVKTRAAEVGSRIARAAAAVMGKAETAAAPAIGRAAALSPGSFDDLRDTALDAAADPVAARARINSVLDGVRLHDPVLADQLGAVQLRGLLHLAEVAPRAPGGPTLADSRGSVSRLERDRFLRRAEVVLDPTVLLDALEDGTLTPAMVQTADAVYLELMANLRGRLLEQMQGGEISPRRKLALSILLGAPATPSLRPENIAAAQARINQEIQNAARKPQASSASKPEEQTRVQRMEGR